MFEKTNLLYNIHYEQYSRNAYEERDSYPHTALGHDKTFSDVLHGRSQCIEIPGCFRHEIKSHIFQT